MQHVETLWAELERLEKGGLPYPEGDDGMAPFPGCLMGQGFFPGGDGLWRDDPKDTNRPPVPIGGILYLGNDFGRVDTFESTLERGHELDSLLTWKYLKKRIKRAEILNPDVRGELGFYTNAVLGLRKNAEQVTEKNVKTDDPRPWNKPEWWKERNNFARSCRKFLEFQLETIQPRLVVILGPSPRFALCFPKPIITELAIWEEDKLLKIDPRKHIRQGKWKGRGITFLLTNHPRSDSRSKERCDVEGQVLAEAWRLATTWSPA